MRARSRGICPSTCPARPRSWSRTCRGRAQCSPPTTSTTCRPRNGSELGLIAGSAALEPMFGARPTQFNGQKFTWIGSANDEPGVCLAWHDTGFARGQDLFDKQLVLGTSGTSNLDFPLALNAVLGTRIRIVRGYNGTSSIMLAMERGEVQGMCGMVYAALQTAHPEWLAQKRVHTLMQIGLDRNEKMAGVPFVMDFAKSDDDR